MKYIDWKKAKGMNLILALLLTMLVTACGGGGGGSSNDDNNTDETSDTVEEDNVLIKPTNNGGGSSQSEIDKRFVTTLNSETDFTFWGCLFETNSQEFGIALTLLEDKTGLLILFDSDAEVLLEIDNAQWVADANSMTIANTEEETGQRFDNYIFFDDVSWDAEMISSDNGSIDVECQLIDQDGNEV